MSVIEHPANLVHQHDASLLFALLDNAPLATIYFQVVVDADDQPVDFWLMLANQAAGKWLAGQNTPVVNDTLTNLFPWATANDWLAELIQVVSNGQLASRDLLYPSTGQWVRLTARAMANGLVLYIDDITDTRRLEANQRTTELLRSVLDETPAGMIASEAVRDAAGQIVDLHFLHVNQQVEHLIGLRPDQIVDRLNTDLFPESMVNGIFDRYVDIIETGAAHTFDQEYRADGIDGWYRIAARKLNDGLIISFLDITALKLAEAQNSQQARLLQIVLDNSPACVALFETIYDTAADEVPVDFCYRMVNRMHTFVTGHDAESLLNRPLLSRFPHLRDTPLYLGLQEVAQTGRSQGLILTDYIGAPGGWFEVQLIHTTRGVLMVCINATEQHYSQYMQKEQDELIKAIVVNSPVGLALVTAQYNDAGEINGLIYKLVNATLAAMSGRTPKQMVNKNLLDVFSVDTVFEPYQQMLQVLETGQPQQFTTPYFQDGAAGWFNNLLVRHGDGLLVCCTDVTEQQQHQQQLETLNQALLRSNENLQQFAFVASHDLQEPLRKVQSFGTLLRNQYASHFDATGIDLLQRMEAAALRMSMLIRDLLEFSRLSTQLNTSKPVALDKLINAIIDDLGLLIAETKTRIVIDKLPTVHGDPTQMRQLFQNLITNAIKFCAADQTPVISISSRPISGDKLAHNPLFPNLLTTNPATGKPRLFHEISVADKGIGFDERYVDRVFGIFQRLHSKSTYAGSGIGLAICKKVVENHGGTIYVTSKPNQGATFRVYLPT